MQTRISDDFRQTAAGQEADSILRSCVHCGFCTATCPTYQLLGDELDSPRGRIYLIKEMLEGAEVSEKTQLHLDRCLTCRACETTCPSGVQYGRLIDIGRAFAEQKVGRSLWQTMQRRMLRSVLPKRRLFNTLLTAGRIAYPLLPARLRASIPPAQAVPAWPQAIHARTMLILDGCVQPGLAPQINVAAARVLDSLGISLLRSAQAGCCGAISHHLNAHDEALDHMRRNIDAWWPHLQQGTEAIVMTASGCGAMVKEYGHLLRHDPTYADKAQHISALTMDISEILAAEQEQLHKKTNTKPRGKLAFHSPCTLQHGQKIVGIVENILTRAGYELTQVRDKHLCCGSAGTYSILQPELSQQLLHNKLDALQAGIPDQIVSANIGCLNHLQSGSRIPVRHWIELIDEILN